MFLKNYQIKVVNALKQFFSKGAEERNKYIKGKALGFKHDWIKETFEGIGKLQGQFSDRPKNGLFEEYPRIIIKVPTGGGKTLLAVEAIREYQNLFAQRKTGLVVWIVPSETIYTQTVQRLRDKSHAYRQLLDQSSGGNTIIIEKGQRLTTQDIENNLVILFVMIQSLNRRTNESLKVFQDSGGYESFFPSDNRYDLHKQLLEQVHNLDFISALGTANPLIKTSMGNAIRVSRPFIIIDEIHKVFSDQARQTIDSLNPEMVLGLSATPKPEMNILITVTGLELKDEDMVKLDMHLLPPASSQENDWKSMLREMVSHRKKLEVKAIDLRQATGRYIRPMALIQVERTGKDQRKGQFVHSLDVKEDLIEQGINADEIAIKTSSQNDIEDIDLFSGDCPVRYIITKEALREGWDCSFAYMLGIIPNVNSSSGVTQLVGRILRQPNAIKTGVPELDESYVYYTKGDTRQILEQVSAGFKNEGLEDLVSKLKVRGNERFNATKTIKIREDFTEKYRGALYLPVWLMIDEHHNQKRRFSYDIDIRPFINLGDFKLTDLIISEIGDSLSEENRERKAIIVTLDDESKTKARAEQAEVMEDKGINYSYATRRFSEVIDNTFLARKKVNEWLGELNKKLGDEKFGEHFSFIISKLTKILLQERRRQEEELFLKHIEEKRLVLAVTDDSATGFKVPESDNITVTGLPERYKYNYYLYEDVEISTMNELERNVGDILDKQEKILWWFRNKVSKGWYAIQGWQEYKIRPDFIAAKKSSDDRIELVYIIESKGEHLIGNADTTYKKKVLDLMTEQNKKQNLKSYQTIIPFDELNASVEAYLIEQNKEEEELRKLMK